MDNIDWALMIVWFFLLTIGHTWKEKYFSLAGAFVGFILMAELFTDSFLFALGLLLINAYIVWTNMIQEM